MAKTTHLKICQMIPNRRNKSEEDETITAYETNVLVNDNNGNSLSKPE